MIFRSLIELIVQPLPCGVLHILDKLEANVPFLFPAPGGIVRDPATDRDGTSEAADESRILLSIAGRCG